MVRDMVCYVWNPALAPMFIRSLALVFFTSTHGHIHTGTEKDNNSLVTFFFLIPVIGPEMFEVFQKGMKKQMGSK